MAVSGKTAAPYEIPYFLSGDKPPDMAAVTKAMAEQLGVLLEERDAKIQAGGVAKTFFSTAELTRASNVYGSFSTPVKVELAKVTASQLIEIIFWGYYGGSTLSELPFLQLVAGLAVAPFAEGTASPTQYQPVTTTAAGLGKGPSVSKAEAEAAMSGANSLIVPAAKLLLKHKAAEDKPLVIEVQGKVPTGTAKLIGAYLSARVVG